MVTHHEQEVAAEPQYWVMAQLSEPKYETEWKFLNAELAFVERKLGKHGASKWFSVRALGFYSRKDWQRYGAKLEAYAKKLQKYADDVEAGVLLPLKFAVYNNSERSDSQVQTKISVKNGRFDEHRKAPERPPRLDGGGKPWPKLTIPEFGGFSRSGIKITEHAMAAEFSALGARDGAVLINQLVHLHCGPDTHLTYTVSSRNVAHETGEVELQDSKPAEPAATS